MKKETHKIKTNDANLDKMMKNLFGGLDLNKLDDMLKIFEETDDMEEITKKFKEMDFGDPSKMLEKMVMANENINFFQKTLTMENFKRELDINDVEFRKLSSKLYFKENIRHFLTFFKQQTKKEVPENISTLFKELEKILFSDIKKDLKGDKDVNKIIIVSVNYYLRNMKGELYSQIDKVKKNDIEKELIGVYNLMLDESFNIINSYLTEMVRKEKEMIEEEISKDGGVDMNYIELLDKISNFVSEDELNFIKTKIDEEFKNDSTKCNLHKYTKKVMEKVNDEEKEVDKKYISITFTKKVNETIDGNQVEKERVFEMVLQESKNGYQLFNITSA